VSWPVLTCLHCNEVWPQRFLDKIPVKCPKCHNKWNEKPIGRGNYQR